MNANQWRALAERLLRQNGCTLAWVRRTLTSDGVAGTVTQAAPPITYQVKAAPLGADARDLVDQQAWQNAQVRLVVAAKTLPFSPETHSGHPAPRFDDLVTWLGVQMRVTAVECVAVSGDAGAPTPVVYFVGLAA